MNGKWIATSACALFTLFLSGTATAAGHAAGIKVMDAWSRELPPVSANGAAYVSLMNVGHADDRLLAVSSPAAARAEIHTHEDKGGMMKMRHVKEGLVVPADGKTDLAPGGSHIMLMKLVKPLKAGTQFPLTLTFEKAGEITVQVNVISMADAAERSKDMHKGMSDDKMPDKHGADMQHDKAAHKHGTN
jgi:copper(I)-binding protein